MDLEQAPLSLYVHLPWCVKKCPYCDFNSHEIGNSKVRDTEYVDALIRDLDFEAPKVRGRAVHSIFFGGGTPSLFATETLEKFLHACRAQLDLAEDVEITLEANPGAVDRDNFSGYRAIGINRLSIGVQSFDTEKLAALGRIHDGDQARQALESARQAGFDNINVDIMYGLPGQSPQQALNDLHLAIAQQPAHISWYQLNIEPNTQFYSNTPKLPGHDVLCTMQDEGLSLMSASHFQRYEISAFSQGGKACRHNLNYWNYGDYLGLGAGAHAKLSNEEDGNITRYRRHRIPAAYMDSAGSSAVLVSATSIEGEERILEFMLNALRLKQGFTETMFRSRTGLGIEVLESRLERAVNRGLLLREDAQIRPSEKGLDFLNDLLELFMPNQSAAQG